LSFQQLGFVFLIFLGISALLYWLTYGEGIIGFGRLFRALGAALFISAFLATAAIFFILLFRIDPVPYMRQTGYYLGLTQLVYFEDIVPPNLADSLAVVNVQRLDTDGDDYEEWVVHYKYDVAGGTSPIKIMVYDNDRGDPPIVFGYSLLAPDREYLGEKTVTLELKQIINNGQNGAEGPAEIVARGEGNTELTIFRFNQNSEDWQPPTDDPRRYQPIGSFRGSGGVNLADSGGRVTVKDRNGMERSQLAIRSIYELQESNTYFESSVSTQLAPPVIQTIDFFNGPPADILNTDFPEKIVLAFYTSTCGSKDGTLCRNRTETAANWKPEDFLLGYDPNTATDTACSSTNAVPSDQKYDACREFQRGIPGYFGLTSLSGNRNILVKNLQYYPQLEQSSSQSSYTGAVPQGNCVVVKLAGSGVVNNGEPPAFQMSFAKGQWKIARRIPLEQCIIETGIPSEPVPSPTPTPPFQSTPTPAATQVPPAAMQ